MSGKGDGPVSLRFEATGWLVFLAFVAAVYGVRRRLNRSAPRP